MLFSLILLCAVGLALLVYRYDLYEKEPISLLLFAFLLGMGSGWLCGVVEDRILIAAGERGESHTLQAALAAVVEELAKVGVVLVVALVCRSEFNDPLDGLVYGAFAGLGAAVEESWFYLQLSPGTLDVVGTEFARLLFHLVLGGIGGFGIGYLWCRQRPWPVVLPAWLLAALGLHFAWDAWCGIPASSPAGLSTQRFLAVGLMVFSLLFFWLSVFLGARRSRHLHARRSKKSLLGWPFNLLVSGD